MRVFAFRSLAVTALLAAARAAALPAAPLDPTPESVLERSIAAMGGREALDEIRHLRIVWVGTQDLSAVYQSPAADTPAPQRRQETLILDVPARRGALRTEGVQSDETPSLWRDTILAETAYTINWKSQRTIPRDAAWAKATWEQWMWSVPQLALKELDLRRRDLRWVGRSQAGGRHVDVLALDFPGRATVQIRFDRETALLAGYAYTAPYVEGPTLFEYVLKPYRKTPGLGMFPSGHLRLIGGRVFRDLDVFDARLADVDGDPWLAPPPAADRPVSRIAAQEQKAESVAPGVVVLRNVGGYNVLAASIGGCVTIVDAPASFDSGGPLPPTAPPADLGKDVLRLTEQAFPGQKVCRVVPTHHHGDHIGGLPSLLRGAPGASVVAAPGSRALAARLAPGTQIHVVADRLVLGEGEERMEIHVVRGARHADELVLVYFPAHRISFEGDLSDYVLAAKRLLQYVETQGLAIDRMYAVHSSSSFAPSGLEGDDPAN